MVSRAPLQLLRSSTRDDRSSGTGSSASRRRLDGVHGSRTRDSKDPADPSYVGSATGAPSPGGQGHPRVQAKSVAHPRDDTWHEEQVMIMLVGRARSGDISATKSEQSTGNGQTSGARSANLIRHGHVSSHLRTINAARQGERMPGVTEAATQGRGRHRFLVGGTQYQIDARRVPTLGLEEKHDPAGMRGVVMFGPCGDTIRRQHYVDRSCRTQTSLRQVSVML